MSTVTATAPCVEQFNMFGPPESIDTLSARAQLRDDAPVPAERELLWPADLAKILGPQFLESRYGDVPRRTRLRLGEVARRCRISVRHIHYLIEAGSLDATDIRHPDATEPSYRVYRYSLVRWLFNRDFVDSESPCCNIPADDLERVLQAAEMLRRSRP